MSNYLTYGNLSAQVSDLINDNSSEMGTMINKWLNVAYRDLFSILPQGPVWTESGPHSITLTGGTSAYALSATKPGRIIGVKLEGKYKPLQPIVSGKLLHMHKELVENGNGMPKAFRFRTTRSIHGATSSFLDIFPAPDTSYADKHIYYIQLGRFTALSASTMVPQIPAEFHDAIMWGATHFAGTMTVDPVMNMAVQMWNRRRKAFKTWAIEQIPDEGQYIPYGEDSALDVTRGF